MWLERARIYILCEYKARSLPDWLFEFARRSTDRSDKGYSKGKKQTRRPRRDAISPVQPLQVLPLGYRQFVRKVLLNMH